MPVGVLRKHGFGESPRRARGVDAATVRTTNSQGLARALGSGLRRIHDLSLGDCPWDWSRQRMLELTRSNVVAGLVDEADFDAKNLGQRAADLLAEFERRSPVAEPLVFTHGDPSLPNVLVYRGRVSGYIDWSREGAGDRYRDLAVSLRSLKNNLGLELEPAFLEGYGVRALNRDKIDYYTTMDEFF